MKFLSIPLALLSLACCVFIFLYTAFDSFEIANRAAEAIDGVKYSTASGNTTAAAEWQQIADETIAYLKLENQRVFWTGLVGSVSSIIAAIFFLLWRKKRSSQREGAQMGWRICWGLATIAILGVGLLMLFSSLEGFSRLDAIFSQDETIMSFPNTFTEQTKFIGAISIGFMSFVFAAICGTKCFSKDV